jgi:excisionase family DNA binding protein
MSDTPMPLSVAVRLCFPHGGATKSTLLAAIRDGKLAYEQVGNRYLVTETDIEAWRETCRRERRDRASGYVSGVDAHQSGSSLTERMSIAQAALRARLKAKGVRVRS